MDVYATGPAATRRGFAETAESTVVAHALPEHLRGNGFGVLGLVQSVGDLGGTLVAGLLLARLYPISTTGAGR